MAYRDSLGRKLQTKGKIKTNASQEIATQLTEAKKRVKSRLRREARKQGGEALASNYPRAL